MTSNVFDPFENGGLSSQVAPDLIDRYVDTENDNLDCGGSNREFDVPLDITGPPAAAEEVEHEERASMNSGREQGRSNSVEFGWVVQVVWQFSVRA